MKRSWPFIVVVLLSFSLGSIWGWKLIQQRNEADGRFEPEGIFRLIAPVGAVPAVLIKEFERRERVLIELSTEESPATLLRKLLKSAPGQYDGAFLYHHQIPSVRAERKLLSLYDARNRFPVGIAPDFRKLSEDRNLMETAPLLWGLLGAAHKAPLKGPVYSNTAATTWDAKLIALSTWPSWLSVFLPEDANPADLIKKIRPVLPDIKGSSPGLFRPIQDLPPDRTIVVSHGQLAESKMADWKFGPLTEAGYPLWVMTFLAVQDGHLDLARKWARFLLEPTVSKILVIRSQGGAGTMRSLEESELPRELRPSYLREFKIGDILLDRDDRVRQTDEMIEQVLAGATPIAVRSTPTPSPSPTPKKRSVPKPMPSAAPQAAGEPKAPQAEVEISGEGAAQPAPAQPDETKAPSGEPPHDD